jgi:hypothetical protein
MSDIVVQSRDEPHETIIDEIIAKLPNCLGLSIGLGTEKKS